MIVVLPDINFRTLRPYDGSQPRAFEELCFQLLPSLEVIPPGAKVTRHGTPDGGVEFTATLADGSIWGWQAKYLFELASDEFGQLDQFVRRALDSQSSLTRYTVCLPYDRPAASIPGRKSAMQRWNEHCEKWRQWAAAKGMEVEFRYIGESELLNALTMPEQAGRVYYWFQATVLTQEWFSQHTAQALAHAGPRYTPALNIDLPIAQVFDGLGRTPEFQERLRQALRRIRDERRYWYSLGQLASSDSALGAWLQECERDLLDLDRRVLDIDLATTSRVDFAGFAGVCATAAGHMRKFAEVLDQRGQELARNTGPSREESKEEGDHRLAAYHVRQTADAVDDLVALATSDAARLTNDPVLLLTGRPGTGKTHLLCDVTQDRLAAGRPTILLFGQHFTNDEPWSQILRQLQLNCTADELLGALNTAAETANARALIFIDAVNESVPADLWRHHLNAFAAKVQGWPRLGLTISCRSSYVPVVIPKELLERELVCLEHAGFTGHEYRAVRTFFAHYHLTLPDFPLLVPEFQNPLFLKLLCQGLSRRGLVSLPRGLLAVTSLFEMVLDLADEHLSHQDRCDYAVEQRLVHQAVNSLAGDMLDAEPDWLPFERALDVSNDLLPGRQWHSSLLKGLVDEGVLVREIDYLDGGTAVEGIRFSYQRLADHLRAATLCDRAGSIDVLASKLHELMADVWTAYRHSGLLEALSVQVPERFGREVYELVSDPSVPPIEDAYLESLIWRDVRAFPAGLSREYLGRIAARSSGGTSRVFTTVLQVTCVPDHPFNAQLLHSTLWRLSMPDRDAWWSIYLHDHHDEGTSVGRLIDWAWLEDTSYCRDEAALLCATALAWFLTSSHRAVRDRATKALDSLLRGRLQVLIELLNRFQGVNDPYLAERLYAVAYGCALITPEANAVAELAETVYRQVFSDGGPPVHILLRDYARGVIERAWYLGAQLPAVDVQTVRPPYRSPWPLRAPSREELERRYPRELHEYGTIWFSVSDLGDFHRYVIEQSVRHFVAPDQRRKRRAIRRQRALAAPGRWQAFVSTLNARGGTNERWDTLINSLSDGQRELLHQAIRDTDSARDAIPTISFDAGLASRWIFARVIGLGWHPQRFAAFDAGQRHDYSQPAPKAERIGKKYQWLALHDLLARLADHCAVLPNWGTSTPKQYDGPWELFVRDVDPSLLLRSHRSAGPEPNQQSWWVPVHAEVPPGITHSDRLTWLRTTDGLPSAVDLIAVQDETGKLRLTLEGHYRWTEAVPPEFDPYEVDRCQLWYQIRTYFVKRGDLETFLKWAQGQNWMGRWMPEGGMFYEAFIGEYAWHPAAAEARRDWEAEWHPGAGRRVPVPLLVTTTEYLAEGRDCSLDGSIRAFVPSSPVLAGLGLTWQGVDFRYMDATGNVVACDPTAREDGPSVLLVDAVAIRTFLEREDLALIWTVLGEKLIPGPLLRGGSDAGRLEISGILALHEDGVREIALSTNYVNYAAT